MNALTAKALGERRLSLTNEQRSELLSLRRAHQLTEKPFDEAPTNQGEHEQPYQPETSQSPNVASSSSHQSKESGHAQEVLHRAAVSSERGCADAAHASRRPEAAHHSP